MKQALFDSASPLALWFFIPYQPRKTAGEQIRAIREAKGMTQAELAARAGTTQVAVSRFETYDYSNYTLRFLAALAHGLDCRANAELTAWEDVRAYHGPAF